MENDPLNVLPTPALVKICLLAGLTSTMRLFSTCKSALARSQDERIWFEAFGHDFPSSLQVMQGSWRRKVLGLGRWHLIWKEQQVQVSAVYKVLSRRSSFSMDTSVSAFNYILDQDYEKAVKVGADLVEAFQDKYQILNAQGLLRRSPHCYPQMMKRRISGWLPPTLDPASEPLMKRINFSPSTSGNFLGRVRDSQLFVVSFPPIKVVGAEAGFWSVAVIGFLSPRTNQIRSVVCFPLEAGDTITCFDSLAGQDTEAPPLIAVGTSAGDVFVTAQAGTGLPGDSRLTNSEGAPVYGESFFLQRLNSSPSVVDGDPLSTLPIGFSSALASSMAASDGVGLELVFRADRSSIKRVSLGPNHVFVTATFDEGQGLAVVCTRCADSGVHWSLVDGILSTTSASRTLFCPLPNAFLLPSDNFLEVKTCSSESLHDFSQFSTWTPPWPLEGHIWLSVPTTLRLPFSNNILGLVPMGLLEGSFTVAVIVHNYVRIVFVTSTGLHRGHQFTCRARGISERHQSGPVYLWATDNLGRLVVVDGSNTLSVFSLLKRVRRICTVDLTQEEPCATISRSTSPVKAPPKSPVTPVGSKQVDPPKENDFPSLLGSEKLTPCAHVGCWSRPPESITTPMSNQAERSPPVLSSPIDRYDFTHFTGNPTSLGEEQQMAFAMQESLRDANARAVIQSANLAPWSSDRYVSSCLEEFTGTPVRRKKQLLSQQGCFSHVASFDSNGRRPLLQNVWLTGDSIWVQYRSHPTVQRWVFGPRDVSDELA
ncbi:MAG: uncharacterized protein KVP18_003545 [Porospora cf. gigantea A]|uniref:uncharacterized protein n=1 Tax=Porospora cf. gigantea A TaxID=2853593 RepID=UPI003559C266|nr:MAG: hypothetical protein KVP18_003545 [Porospora cf. gigantea A]